jgi:hypothetical protein
MIRMYKLGAAVIAAGLSLLPSVANAQASTQFISAGSSALWQTAAIASWELTGKLHHYTYKLTGTGVGVVDTRNTTNIAPAQGGLWIVWDSSTAPTKIFAGVSLDSTVGNRLFLGTDTTGVPAGKLVLPATTPAPGNLISVTWGVDDTSLPSAVIAAINASPRLTAALTDIRPEDSAFATARARAALGASVNDGSHNYDGLGYNGPLSGTPTKTNWVESAYSTSAFQVVTFNTHGTDPISGATVPPFTSYRVGVSPIILVDNRTNASGLGALNSGGKYYFTNLTSANARTLWTGANCSTAAFAVSGAPTVPVTVNLREPLSGTYNTFEYQVINVPYTSTLANQTSQENNVNPASATGNPLSQTCAAGSGIRARAIGTGEMINTAVLKTADSIGYAFFSFGNVSKIAGSTSYGYLTLNGVDPINATYSNGELPTTGTISTLFSHVKDGTYASWSDLRIITNNVSKNQTVAESLSAQIQSDITSGAQLPDFVPFSSANLYRSHYSNGTYTNGSASNGLAGGTENGGDVNGCIEIGNTAPGTLNCRN